MIDISELPYLEESVLLTPNTVKSVGVLSRVRDEPKYWHMFCIFGVDIEGKQILRHIINFIYPHDLLPVYFIKKPTRAYFLARNCMNAIVQFCKSGLIIYNPQNADKPYKLEIVGNIETTENIKVIDVQKNLLDVLEERCFDGYLNLQNFCDDPGLQEFCPLSQQKILTYVLHLAERFKPTKLNLENNDLRTIEALEKFSDFQLTHINLKKNRLQNINSLKTLKKFKLLSHIWLDQNPFIEKLPDSVAYIAVARDMCPKIECLDGISIPCGIPPPNKTFLCTDDAAHFTNQFLEYYFPLYDEDREKLSDLYDPRLCRFSVTYSCSANNKKLFPMLEEPEHFKFRSRNLLVERSDLFLYKEWIVISNIFSMLPRTKHDPYSFLTDVMHYTKDSAIIIVTGCFKEFGDFSEKVYSFSRTFILKCIFRRTHTPDASAVWVITNDQLNVMYPSLFEISDIKDEEKKTISEILKNPVSNKNYAELEKTFELLTLLKPQYARAFLESSQYNLKDALQSFIELSRSDAISSIAFKDDKENSQVNHNRIVEPIQPRPVPSIVPSPADPMISPTNVQNVNRQLPNLQPQPQIISPVPPPNLQIQNAQRPILNLPPHPILNPKGAGWPRVRQLVPLPRSVTNAQNHPLLKNGKN